MRETTSARVRAAIEELGYVPDGAAQSLARNRKDVIGLVCVEHTGLNPNQYDIESMSLLFYDEVMRGRKRSSATGTGPCSSPTCARTSCWPATARTS